MAETFKNMKEAVMGSGGGLQSGSTAAGGVLAENSDVRSKSTKQTDESTSSLKNFAKGAGGNTTSGTNVSTSDQIANQQTGAADHLELGMRKQT